MKKEKSKDFAKEIGYPLKRGRRPKSYVSPVTNSPKEALYTFQSRPTLDFAQFIIGIADSMRRKGWESVFIREGDTVNITDKYNCSVALTLKSFTPTSEAGYRERIDDLLQKKDEAASDARWYKKMFWLAVAGLWVTVLINILL